MKIGFFEDSNGNRSMMRLLAFMVVTTGLSMCIFCGVWMTVYNTDQLALIGLFIGLVGTGLGAKWMQKITEKETNEKA